jgi:hypothetical protein
MEERLKLCKLSVPLQNNTLDDHTGVLQEEINEISKLLAVQIELLRRL